MCCILFRSVIIYLTDLKSPSVCRSGFEHYYTFISYPFPLHSFPFLLWLTALPETGDCAGVGSGDYGWPSWPERRRRKTINRRRRSQSPSILIFFCRGGSVCGGDEATKTITQRGALYLAKLHLLPTTIPSPAIRQTMHYFAAIDL